MAERIGVYPGTFDPITLGHSDIIRRGAKLVDRLIIGVTTNPSKNPLFTPAERIAMVEREVASLQLANVSVVGFNALLMKFAERQGASVIVRGLRAVADFEYEYQMAGMNQQLNAGIETLFRPRSSCSRSRRNWSRKSRCSAVMSAGSSARPCARTCWSASARWAEWATIERPA